MQEKYVKYIVFWIVVSAKEKNKPGYIKRECNFRKSSLPH